MAKTCVLLFCWDDASKDRLRSGRLFVFALILIVGNRRVLLLLITAFTLAHSLTLALATLEAGQLYGPMEEDKI